MPTLLHKHSRPLRILIVEDEALIAFDLQTIIEDHDGIVVAIANSGEQAIALAQKLRPEVVMMDISLSGAMDGVDAATVIRNTTPCAIVFVTGNVNGHTLERIEGIGNCPVVPKPVDPEVLVRRIRDACGAA